MYTKSVRWCMSHEPYHIFYCDPWCIIQQNMAEICYFVIPGTSNYAHIIVLSLFTGHAIMGYFEPYHNPRDIENPLNITIFMVHRTSKFALIWHIYISWFTTIYFNISICNPWWIWDFQLIFDGAWFLLILGDNNSCWFSVSKDCE